VRLAVEACFNQLVYSSSTMLRLIESAGEDVVGANLDPSHLIGMGADIPTVIRTLGESIFHVHAKDARINTVVTARDGLLTTHPIEKANVRAWNYVTLGLGHPAGGTFWADFVHTLRSMGYDGTMNIEHEDVLVNSVEGVTRDQTASTGSGSPWMNASEARWHRSRRSANPVISAHPHARPGVESLDKKTPHRHRRRCGIAAIHSLLLMKGFPPYRQRRTVTSMSTVVRATRVVLIVMLAMLAISFIMALGTSKTGLLEKVALLLLIGGCVCTAAKVTRLSERIVQRLRH
jgi:hypothetical protein